MRKSIHSESEALKAKLRLLRPRVEVAEADVVAEAADEVEGDPVEAGDEGVVCKEGVGVTDPRALNYTWPLVMLACLGIAALIIGVILNAVDKKKHLGLEEPNIK